jgi:hypothetical protein
LLTWMAAGDLPPRTPVSVVAYRAMVMIFLESGCSMRWTS